MTFDQFLKKFPPTTLPVSITEESVSGYSRDNEPLPGRMIEDFLLPFEGQADEMTEFVPGFRLPNTKDFQGIVYWKAGLLNYEYVLATFEKGGKLIDRQVIAGTFSDGSIIARSVARIDEDLTIYIVSGVTAGSEETYDANESTARELELLPSGKIVELTEQ